MFTSSLDDWDSKADEFAILDFLGLGEIRYDYLELTSMSSMNESSFDGSASSFVVVILVIYRIDSGPIVRLRSKLPALVVLAGDGKRESSL